jgi:hypothetical protein
MKTTLLASTLALLATTAFVTPVEAGKRGDKVAVALGGFIGGVIVGSHINNSPTTVHHTTVVSDAWCPPPRHGTTVVIHRPALRPSGYWTHVTERVWIPAERIVSHDCHGRRVVTHIPGRYEAHTRRVWVDTTPRHPHGRW